MTTNRLGCAKSLVSCFNCGMRKDCLILVAYTTAKKALEYARQRSTTETALEEARRIVKEAQ